LVILFLLAWLTQTSGTGQETQRHGKPQWSGRFRPAPGSQKRKAPVENAQKVFKIFSAHFQAEFPMWEESNTFAAFDLSAPLSLDDRKVLLRAVAAKHSVNFETAWLHFAGSSVGSGLLARAQWHQSQVGRCNVEEARRICGQISFGA
jgi:hypothetical protein